MKTESGLPPALKAAEKAQQVTQFLFGQGPLKLVAMLREYFFERCCAAIVEEGIALANAQKRRRIEFLHPLFIAEADVVRFRRRIDRRHMAIDAAEVLK